MARKRSTGLRAICVLQGHYNSPECFLETETMDCKGHSSTFFLSFFFTWKRKGEGRRAGEEEGGRGGEEGWCSFYKLSLFSAFLPKLALSRTDAQHTPSVKRLVCACLSSKYGKGDLSYKVAQFGVTRLWSRCSTAKKIKQNDMKTRGKVQNKKVSKYACVKEQQENGSGEEKSSGVYF